MSNDYNAYDFLDFGASRGGSIDFARTLFGGGRGLGIDLDPAKVREMEEAGHDCLQADITSLEVPDGAVRFVMISHLLEHLPTLGLVEATLRSAARVARDFVYIQGPVFDGDEFLRENGLKVYWADWTGHPCHLTTWELQDILARLGLDDHVLMVTGPMESSDHPSIHPLGSPPDQHDYDPEVHPPKPSADFGEKVLYREFVCCVRLRPFPGWSSTVRRIQETKKAVVLDAPPADERESTVPEAWNVPRFREIHRRLLLERHWDFLSYLHLRDAILRLGGVDSLVTTNRRRGYQEIALALEFPGIEIHFQPPPDLDADRYDAPRQLVGAWELGNVRLGEPGGEPPKGPFDLAAATEGFDGSDRDRELVARLRGWSRKRIWALTGFSARPSEPWRGYSSEELAELAGPGEIHGCFWVDEGLALKRDVEEMPAESVRDELETLRLRGLADLGGGRPIPGVALAQWILGPGGAAP